MEMLGLKETVVQMAKANGVSWGRQGGGSPGDRGMGGLREMGG